MDVQYIVSPVPSKDYPRTWNEFQEWFGSEEACQSYLERLRWPDGFVCPSCADRELPYRASRLRLMCRQCNHQTSITAGTIFDKTRTPLRVWFAAAWYLTNQKQGVSALGLQRVLGLGSYQTAWAMLHRLRRAMVRPDRDQLKGHVEVDETYLDITDRKSVTTSLKRKSNTTKLLMVIAVELLKPKGFGRIRLRQIPKEAEAHILPFIQESIGLGSKISTDGSAAYRSLARAGYDHQPHVMLGSDRPAHVSMAGVHRVASLIKRWMMGTHHGAIQPNQIGSYLDEFVFRFNRRTSRSRGLLFYRLMQQAVVTNPVTYQDVIRKKQGKIR
jgi:hypothetical protein